MAIIIPSRNIYDKDNNKLLDNKIEKVEFSATEPINNNNYNVSVYTDTITSFYTEKTVYKNGQYTDVPSYATYGSIELQPTYLRNYDPRISVSSNLKTITNIYGGVDVQNNPNIKYSVYYTKRLYAITWDNNNKTYEKTLTQESSGIGKIPTDDLSRTLAYEGTSPLTVSEKIDDETNISNVNFRINTVYDYWWSDKLINILVGYRSLAQGRRENTYYNIVDMIDNSYEVEYIPQRLEITLNGDTTTIELSEKSLVYGESTSKSIFSVQNNELLQTTNTYTENGVVSNAIEKSATRTIDEFGNGKETATLLCDINEYYDENGSLMISANDTTKPMTFKIGNIVKPKVFGANREDRPMSVKSDGTAKSFVVLGVEPYFDGAVWQKLFLREL